MSSFEQKYYLTDAGLLTRLRRDLRLLWESLAFLFYWATRGRQLRASYRKATRENTEIVLDNLVEKKP